MGVFFRELHALTRAGIAIGPACRELERRAPARARLLATDMAAAAETGQPISSALETYGALIYPWHLGVIRAAEVGGFLPEAFDQIARAYETEWETRSALRLRLFVYVGLGLPAVLLTAPLFLTIAQPIPRDGWTQDLLVATVLRFLKTVSLPAALGLIALWVVWQVLQSLAWFQALQQRLVIHLPVVGGIARGAALDRYLATLGLMLRGGLPVAQAAEEAAMAAGSAAITPKLLELVPALRQGQSLSSLLAGTRLLSADTLHMAATGEISGSLPDMLARAAGYYQQDNEGKRRVLLRLAQVLFGVLWLAVLGGLFLLGVKLYFAFAFKTYEWMMEGFE
ncbi:MAG: type II secretion system F family protein [Armatimonadota bacterium]